MNYNHRKFRPVSNSENGEVSSEMLFHYEQTGAVLTCTYEGENIVKGQLIGLVDEDGNIDMRYHQVNKNGEIRTGACRSTPELLASGKIRLHEQWEWTSGDRSQGSSTLDEV